ncbi:RsmB/NOP family class I SAM-dependent RNA methyltransferase [Pelagibius litoralis]|uniref:RsmB/NOP family class I SAM-dependent RNA methyltransferase n=1 Tax=Pelagibius litoralis TaxID=374515 RepID=A0A967EZJ6_9PROT|nr:RsmB/NOP family class I SAM-dependent RNA methyltransferase [Pelagibius litoralis]NIA70331.1 RsmB/NOP family class I SAM-dependent RNA methyltransferase [Pelagibius litoralis]
MTPAARIQAVIEVVGQLDQAARPAEQTVSDYYRQRRYIGSKDRRAISALTYAVLRHRARLAWHLGQCKGRPPWGRSETLAFLLLSGQETVETLEGLCNGEGYGPAVLTQDEGVVLQSLQGQALSTDAQPEEVRHETPGWLMPSFTRAFGPAVEAELDALLQEAPLDLRCNTLKTDRAAALAALAAEGIEAEPTPLSPLGLRVSGRRALRSSRAYVGGLVEIQDEGSQLAALLCDAAPGMAVADVCAGAGGKTLALAAAMAGQGCLLAADVDGARLDRAVARLRRAGADFVERRVLADLAGAEDLAACFDRVLIDAPCSGTGAWRRQPDARWRLTPADLARYRAAQQETLSKAAALVRPGGRMVYVTCSLLPEENEDQVEAFLQNHPQFSLHPAAETWERVIGGAFPGDGPFLTLTPARQGTDGFFVAILQREGPA